MSEEPANRVMVWVYSVIGGASTGAFVFASILLVAEVELGYFAWFLPVTFTGLFWGALFGAVTGFVMLECTSPQDTRKQILKKLLIIYALVALSIFVLTILFFISGGTSINPAMHNPPTTQPGPVSLAFTPEIKPILSACLTW